ncbi:MAG: hypothetical protein J6C28_03820 [Bacilli bacterium]|nr:hypothetical protein [Bacilli bacterium]
MNNDNILKSIETENFVWIIYLFIIGISFVANSFEKDYYVTGNVDSKNKYRIINIFAFATALLIYLYFFYDNYKNIKNLNCNSSKEKIFFNNLNFVASILIVIAGTIFLYIALYDKNLDTEIAFN